MIFDGRAFAREIEATIRLRLQSGVRVPKIVSILVGNDPSSELYTRLKKQAAERVGIEFEIVKIDSDKLQVENLSNVIREIGARNDVTGVMVQLPLPGVSRKDTEEVLKSIPLDKDVDGLRWAESSVMPATVKAIISILQHIQDDGAEVWNKKMVVVGAGGAVGKPLVIELQKRGVTVESVFRDTPEPFNLISQGDVVISCVGKAGLVTGEMVKYGVIAISVGMEEVNGKMVGDMTDEVYQKASVVVPVIGGVGPVTIASLMQNAVEIVYGS